MKKLIAHEHVFLCVKDFKCAVCSAVVPRGDYYARIEPTDRKKPSFKSCKNCAGMK